MNVYLWLAQLVVFFTACYFLLLGVVALFKPTQAGRFLLGFAGSSVKHYLELALRLIVGAALLAVANESSARAVLSVAGWVLIGSTLALALLPWRIHHRFAQISVPRALRYLPLIGVASIFIALLLGWVLVDSIKS
jgi:hypothetical protein